MNESVPLTLTCTPHPQEIGQSGMIKQGVYFNSNSLTGTLPTQLGNVNLYNYMKFHSNKLSGAIPTQVSCGAATPADIPDRLRTAHVSFYLPIHPRVQPHLLPYLHPHRHP